MCVTDLFSLFASDLGGYAAREDIEAVLQILDGETPASLQKCFIEVSHPSAPSSECFLLCKAMFGCLSLCSQNHKIPVKTFRRLMVYVYFRNPPVLTGRLLILLTCCCCCRATR